MTDLTAIIPPLPDLWWAEPCAGSGNILRQMPVDRRIGWDINPLDNGVYGIIQADYTMQRLDPNHKWVVLTNPPFRDRGATTLFEWAARQSCVVAIGLVAPHYFQRHTVQNRLNPHFHRVHRETLPLDSFLREGQVKYVPTIFEVWVRRSTMRDQMVVRTEHPDWLWLGARRIDEADVWMQNRGEAGLGEIKSPDNLGCNQGARPDWHWFIKEVRPGTIERLKRIDWKTVGLPTVTIPRLNKDEVVAAYIAAHRDPESPDYDPPHRSAGEDIATALIPPPPPPAAPSEALAADPDSHPDLEWIPLRRGHDEATVWIGRRGPNVGRVLDGTKQVPPISSDYHALRCKAPAMAILQSIAWRSLADGGTLSKHTVSHEYTRVKLGSPTT
jgi:hypothetical protein